MTSTYAVDTEISNDNKIFALAEIDTDGINVSSSIKFIDMNNASENNVKKIELENNMLITDIEFTEKNELLIITDSKAYLYNNGQLTLIVDSFDESTISASIENANNLVTISKKENGLFETKYFMTVYYVKDIEYSKKSFEIENIPLMMTISNKNIALVFENEIEILNMNGKVLKRMDSFGSIKKICFFNDDNYLAVVLRDRVEIFKI